MKKILITTLSLCVFAITQAKNGELFHSPEKNDTLLSDKSFKDNTKVKKKKIVTYNSNKKNNRPDTSLYKIGNTQITIINNNKQKFITINEDTVYNEKSDSVFDESTNNLAEEIEEMNKELEELFEDLNKEFDISIPEIKIQIPDIDVEIPDVPKPPALPEIDDENSENDKSNKRSNEQDTTTLHVGRKRYHIISNPDIKHIYIEKNISTNSDDDDKHFKIKIVNGDTTINECYDEDRTHTTNFCILDMGINTFLYKKGFNLPDQYHFLDLNLAKSIGVNFLFFESGLNIIKENLKLKYGLGLEYNNYRFNENYTLMPDTFDVVAIEEKNIFFNKNKLTTKFITSPILLQFQTNENENGNSFFIAAGVNFGYNLKAYTKQVYEINGNKHKDKLYDDFNIEKIRYGLTGRIGYGSVNFFVNYALSSLFEKGTAPELYPLTAGIRLIGL